jgi:radical SAM PhpK family P-methyltransferase
MNATKQLDCVVIGYNELPFEGYESFLRGYGEDSEAYRDLRFSFVELGGRKMDYVGLLNMVAREAGLLGEGEGAAAGEFKSGDIPSLAAAFLVNYLRRSGHTAGYVNLFQHEKERLKELLDADPLCVAITTTLYVVNLPVNEMVEFIRSHNPKVKIVVGGPLVANHVRNYEGEELRAALADIGADIYVVEGQGERTLSRIVSALKEGEGLGSVPNLIRFVGGEMTRTRTEPENNSLDEHYIDWRGFPGERLGRTIQTRTARSCAFKCSFCNYPTRAGALTLASTETVEKELDSMRALGVQNVVFIDDTFNVPLPRFKNLCRMMIKNNYGFNWYSYFRCSNSDEEAFDLMAESGCKGVFLGIESGSPTILENMNKSATIERYAKGIEMLRRRGILTFGSFIVGFPGETAETVEETINFIRETRPDYYRAQMWYCEPGTPIQHRREEFKIEGEGFVWSHATMDSLEAMDHIERMFLSVSESVWLPQWSFDFWIIPYLTGRGVTAENFRGFMAAAERLLKMEIASVPAHQKKSLQHEYVQGMIKAASGWKLSA